MAAGDRAAVAACFEPPANFYLPSPVSVEKYVIRRRIVYGPKEVRKWNSKGITPPALEGDIELQVEQTVAGRTVVFDYNFRLVGHDWKIIAHSGPGPD